MQEDLDVETMGKGFFFFRFNYFEDSQRVLEKGPWFIDGHPLALKSWSEDLPHQKEQLESLLPFGWNSRIWQCRSDRQTVYHELQAAFEDLYSWIGVPQRGGDRHLLKFLSRSICTLCHDPARAHALQGLSRSPLPRRSWYALPKTEAYAKQMYQILNSWYNSWTIILKHH